MRVDIAEIELAPVMPRDLSRGIGIVGAGLIIGNAHMPAYRKAGFRVAAIYDVRTEAAHAVADRFGIPVVCNSIDDLLAREDVAIVDMAVSPDAQVSIARKAIAAGKEVLCHKPLSEDFADAVALVEEAEAAGRILAVNQQMRWSPGIHMTRRMIELGAYGTVTECTFDVDLWSEWSWMGQRPRVEYFYNSIHYLDAIRSMLGEPLRVLASSAQFPGQKALAETRSFTILEYAGDLRAIVLSNHNNWSGKPRAILRCHGTDGRSEATLGMKDYPVLAGDIFEFTSRDAFGVTARREFRETWMPDSFVFPMANVMRSIEDGTPPATSGRDNLGTLRIIEAAYRSIAEGRRVALSEL